MIPIYIHNNFGVDKTSQSGGPVSFGGYGTSRMCRTRVQYPCVILGGQGDLYPTPAIKGTRAKVWSAIPVPRTSKWSIQYRSTIRKLGTFHRFQFSMCVHMCTQLFRVFRSLHHVAVQWMPGGSWASAWSGHMDKRGTVHFVVDLVQVEFVHNCCVAARNVTVIDFFC